MSDTASPAGPEERPRAAEQALVEIACTHCGRSIAWCSFCDRTDCPDPNCLACLVVALRESGSSLHRHGG